MSTRKRDNKGYSLAELLVVIGIMGVLAGISFVAVSQYRKNLKLLEMDRTAQEIYIAAQNHLTQASTGTGFRKDVKDAQAGGTSLNLGTKMTTEPLDWDAAEYGPWDDVKDDMYFIQYNSSVGSDSDDLLAKSMLKYVLPYGAIDDYVRADCQYVIEYNAASDAIYAVYYTDSKDDILEEIGVLQASAGDTNGRQYRNLDDAKRSTNRSRTAYNSGKVIIGYYGGSSITLPYGLSLEENTVVVHNGNRLWAEVYCPVGTKIADMGNLLVAVKVQGEVSGAVKVLYFQVGKTSTDFVKDPAVSEAKAISDSEFDAMKLTGFRGIEFVLDDVCDSDGHFSQIFAGADADGKEFYPGEDIRISVETTIADSSTAPKGSNEVVTNSLFSAVEEESYVTSSDDPVAIKSDFKDQYALTAKVSTFRHLENLDPVISGVKNVSDEFELTQAFLIDDIIWKSKDNKFEYVNEDGNVDIYVRGRMRDGHTNGKVTDCIDGDTYFTSESGYRGIITPEITVFDGQDNVIKNTSMIGNAVDSKKGFGYEDAGLFRNVPEGFLIKNVVLEDTEVHAAGNAGLLIGQVDLLVSLYNDSPKPSHSYDLSRTGYAAISDVTIRGQSSVNCKNSETAAPVADGTTFAFDADTGAGLLVGKYSGSGNLQINNVTDIDSDNDDEVARLYESGSVKKQYTEAVYGLNAGGLVGIMKPGTDASITGRVYLGRLTNVTASGGAAGGIVGLVDGTNKAGIYGNVDGIKTDTTVTGFVKDGGDWVFSPSDQAYTSDYLTGIVGIIDEEHPDLTTAMAPASEQYGDSTSAYSYNTTDFSRYLPAEADRTLFNTLGMKAANINVSSDTAAGGFVGKVSGKGEFTNDMVYYRPLDGETHADADDACPQAKANVVSTSGTAGGFVGTTEGSSASYFTNCGSQSIVAAKSGGSAGGFAGTVGDAIAFSRCYSGGHTVTNEATSGVSKYDTKHFNVTGATAGGFAGIVKSGASACAAAEDTGYIFTHCFSTSSVEGTTCGGGFVGYDYSSRYNYSGVYAAGLVKVNYSNKSIEDNYQAPGMRSVGGFAGHLTCSLEGTNPITVDPDDHGVVGISYKINGGGEVNKEYPKASYYYYGVNRSTDGITPVGNSVHTGAPVEIDSDTVKCPGQDGSYFIYEAPYDPATAAVRMDVNQVRQVQPDTYSRKQLLMDQTMTFVDKSSSDGTLKAPFIFSAFKELGAGQLAPDTYHASDKKYGITVGCLMNSGKNLCTAVYSDWQEPRQKTGFVYGYGYRETEAKVNGDKTMLEPVKEIRTVSVKDSETGQVSQRQIQVDKYHWYVVNALKSKVSGEIYQQVVQDDLIKIAYGDDPNYKDVEPLYNMDGAYTLMVIPESGVEEETWDAETEEKPYDKVLASDGVLHDEFVKLYQTLNPSQESDPNEDQLFQLAQLFNKCDMVDFDGQLCHSYSFTSQVVLKAQNQSVSENTDPKLNETYLCGPKKKWLAIKAYDEFMALYKQVHNGMAPSDVSIYSENDGSLGKFVSQFYSFRYFKGDDGIYISLQRAGLPGIDIDDDINEAGKSTDIITTPTGRSNGEKQYFFRFNTRFAASVDIVVGDETTACTTDIFRDKNVVDITRTEKNMLGWYFNQDKDHPYLIRTAKQLEGIGVNLGGYISGNNAAFVYLMPENYFKQGADIWVGPGNYDSENGGKYYSGVVCGSGARTQDGMKLEGIEENTKEWNRKKGYFGGGFYGFYSGLYYGDFDTGKESMDVYSTLTSVNSSKVNKRNEKDFYKYTVVLNQTADSSASGVQHSDHIATGVFMENLGTIEYLRSAGKITFSDDYRSTSDRNLIGGIASWNDGIVQYCDSATDIVLKINSNYKYNYCVGGVVASSANYKNYMLLDHAELNNCVFDGTIKMYGNDDKNIDVSSDKKIIVGGVLGSLTKEGLDGYTEISSIITDCVNKGNILVEASEQITAKTVDVGGVVGQSAAPDKAGVKYSSLMKDGDSYRELFAGSVIKCRNEGNIFVGSKTLNSLLYVGGISGSGTCTEGAEKKSGFFVDCVTSTDMDKVNEGEKKEDKGIVLAIGKINAVNNKDYSVFAGGIVGSLAAGVSNDQRACVTWNEKDTENPQVATPITLKNYDGDNIESETGIGIGGIVGSLLTNGNNTEISNAVVSEKAKLSVSASNQLTTRGFLAIGGVVGSGEAPDSGGNRNKVDNIDVKNDILVKSKIWSAQKEPMIGGVCGRMYYGEIYKANVSSEIKVDITDQITNNADMFVAGIVGCDGKDGQAYMSNEVNSCTYSGKLYVIPDRWIQSEDVFIGGISGRQITDSGKNRGTNNVRNGALLEAKIGHVKDGNDFYIGGIAGSTDRGQTTFSNMGVDTAINLYCASNAEIDAFSGVYAGGAVGSAGPYETYGDFDVNNSYVTCNFRNAFAISSNYLEDGRLMENEKFEENFDNGVYVGGLIGEKQSGRIKLKKAYVSVRFNNKHGDDSWGTNEAIIMSTDSGSELNGVEFEDCFAVQRTSYAFTDTVSKNGAEFRYGTCQMAPYFYKYTGVTPASGGTSMYAKFYSPPATQDAVPTIEYCNFKFNSTWGNFPVQGCAVVELGDDDSFATMATDALGSGWSKRELYPVRNVNGHTEDTGHMVRETVWPMYIGSSAGQASNALDVISNLFNGVMPNQKTEGEK